MKCCSETLKSLPGSRQKNTYILSRADSLSTLLSLSSLFTTNRICNRAAQPLGLCSSWPLSPCLSPHGDIAFGNPGVRSRVPGAVGTADTSVPSRQAGKEFRCLHEKYSSDVSKKYQLGADAFRAIQVFLNISLPGMKEQ